VEPTRNRSPSWRSFSYWTDYLTGPWRRLRPYRATGHLFHPNGSPTNAPPVFSSQGNLRSCYTHDIPTVEPPRNRSPRQSPFSYWTDKTFCKVFVKRNRSSTIGSAISDYVWNMLCDTAHCWMCDTTKSVYCLTGSYDKPKKNCKSTRRKLKYDTKFYLLWPKFTVLHT
jgi:hypothetical protein